MELRFPERREGGSVDVLIQWQQRETRKQNEQFLDRKEIRMRGTHALRGREHLSSDSPIIARLADAGSAGCQPASLDHASQLLECCCDGRRNKPHSINIWDNVTPMVPLCSVHRTKPREPRLAASMFFAEVGLFGQVISSWDGNTGHLKIDMLR